MPITNSVPVGATDSDRPRHTSVPSVTDAGGGSVAVLAVLGTGARRRPTGAEVGA